MSAPFTPAVERLLAERFAPVPHVAAAVLNDRLPDRLRINPATGERVVFKEQRDAAGNQISRPLTAAECQRLENRFRRANEIKLATVEPAALEAEWGFPFELKRAIREIAADKALAVQVDGAGGENIADDGVQESSPLVPARASVAGSGGVTSASGEGAA